jgi:hypothetical protein
MKHYSWILGAIGLLALCAFGAHAVMSDVWLVEWEVAGGAGAVLVLLSLWFDRQNLSRYFMSRGAQYSAMAGALVAVAVGVAVAVNVIAQRYDHRFDVTASQRHALSGQTISILAGLEADIELHAFFAPGLLERDQLETLFDGFSEHTDRLTVAFHDPITEPLIAREFDITTEYGTIVLRSGEDSQRLESRFDEESIVNALVQLTAGQEHQICFTEGHEEVDPDDDTSGVGVGAAVMKLEGKNYTVQKVFPARDGAIPESCEVVVVGDPQLDFMPAEREMLAAHVASGRALLVMLEPTRTPELATDLSRYNLLVGDDLVLEQNPNYQLMGGDLSYIVLSGDSFDFHPITNPIRGAVLMRVARSVVRLDPDMTGIQVQELARTSAFAWAETDYMATTAPSPDPGTDRLGPVPVMAVAEVVDPSVIGVGSTRVLVQGSTGRALPVDLSARSDGDDGDAEPSAGDPPVAEAGDGVPDFTPKSGGRVVVIGDVDFATNELLDQFNNRDLFLNTLAWLVGEDDHISISSDAGTGGRFNMTEAQFLIVMLLSMLIAPGMAVMGAVGAWRDRRRR